MERDLLTFKTGHRSQLLYDLLQDHQTKSCEHACQLLESSLAIGFSPNTIA